MPKRSSKPEDANQAAHRTISQVIAKADPDAIEVVEAPPFRVAVQESLEPAGGAGELRLTEALLRRGRVGYGWCVHPRVCAGGVTAKTRRVGIRPGEGRR